MAFAAGNISGSNSSGSNSSGSNSSNVSLAEAPARDLALLSLCQHHIVGYGYGSQIASLKRLEIPPLPHLTFNQAGLLSFRPIGEEEEEETADKIPASPSALST